MSYAKVKYERQGDVAVITMSDPSTLNAVALDMVAELTDAFGRASREARCALLTGEGRAFSSGANLSADYNQDLANFDAGLPLETHHNPFCNMLRDLPIPFVTAVNGAAAGISCSYALLGDIILAGESAYFLHSFRRIGLVADGGSTFLLPRTIGRARALEMMLLGEKLPAAKAFEWGLINRCVPDAELMPAALAIAEDLAKGATRSLVTMRQLVSEGMEADWRQQLQAEREAQREMSRTEDFREGLFAFLQKRPPDFKGA